jgi:hypothetical protein
MPNKRGKKKARGSKSAKSDTLAAQVNRVYARTVALTDRLVAAEKALRQALNSAGAAPSPTAPARRTPVTKQAGTRRAAARAAATTAARKPRTARSPRRPRTPSTTDSAS